MTKEVIWRRPFLKWAGGKYRLLPQLKALLPAGKTFIEPFVGAGAVFLNTDYPHYRLNDNNPTLIQLYQILQKEGRSFIDDAKKFFTPQTNCATFYYQQRDKFNHTECIREKALLFIYLNRHGYNGLCRFNSKGFFNVPFGQYNKPYFPEKEMYFFHQKSRNVKFSCFDFARVMNKAKANDVIYCDPPYAPLSSSANFTHYSPQGFNEEDQRRLALLASTVSQKGATIVLSNHDTPFIREIYQNAISLQRISVQRSISCKTTERHASYEILAVFGSGG